MSKVDIGGHAVELDLDEEEVVLDVLVILRVTRLENPPGSSALVTAASDTTDYITQFGMIHIAAQVLQEEMDDVE